MYKKVFNTGEGLVLALYSKNPGVVIAELPETKRIARVTWVDPKASRANLEGTSNIDYFLVAAPEIEAHEVIDFKRAIPRSINPEQIEASFGVHYQILAGSAVSKEMIRRIATWDIRTHTRDSKPEAPRSPGIEYVDKIVSTAVPTSGSHAIINPKGKQDFIPQCVLDISLDFTRYCISGVQNDGAITPDGACLYCYAARTHKDWPMIRTVTYDGLRKQIASVRRQRAKEGLPTRYLRLGKNTDAGADFFRGHIVTTLRAIKDEGMSVIFPTKYLKFDKTIAKLLRGTDSTLLYSMGSDSLEQGPVHQGMTNAVRFKRAKLYLNAGVRAVPYVMVDATMPEGGFFSESFREAMKFPQVLLLPIRINSRELASKMGEDWDNLKASGRYTSEGSTLVHAFVHESLEELIGDNSGNRGMCGHSHDTVWCNGCFMPNEPRLIAAREKVKVARDHEPLITRPSLKVIQ